MHRVGHREMMGWSDLNDDPSCAEILKVPISPPALFRRIRRP
jgi:hypothetical protein